MNFLLFAGYNYYPSGGWDDFKGSFSSREEAIKYAKGLADYDWVQVVNLQTESSESFTTKELTYREIS